jgi:mRNA-degrading endonuclease RelE of RelBE toxin-antitoxin system
MKSARSNYFSDKIEENKNDPKKDLGYKSKTEETNIVREHNSLKTNSSVTGCKTSFLL